MRRLPDEAALSQRLRRGEVGPGLLDGVARRLADFHRRAEAGPRVSAGACFEAVARRARENFEQSAAQVGVALSAAVAGRLRALTEEALARHRPRIEARAARGVPRDTHGDLRLEHVYAFPGRAPPADLAVIDCVEFDERYRFADPIADVATLAVGLACAGRRDLTEALFASYCRAAEDAEGRVLARFYTAYRAAVRGKVEGLTAAAAEVPAAERAAALGRARAHWLLALAELEGPD
jgi:aminoglycoside phosphotransferase family enzyme